MIRFSIPINPVAKARARVTRRGSYTPDTTARFERDVHLVASQFKAKAIMCGPIRVWISCYLIPPKRKVRELPCVKPDLDNYSKAMCDALNGVLWKDDGQIVDLRARKFYSWVDRKPRIEIEVEEVTEPYTATGN